MNINYGKENIDEIEQYGLLRRSISYHPDLDQFLLYHAAKENEDLEKVAKEFRKGMELFSASEAVPYSKFQISKSPRKVVHVIGSDNEKVHKTHIKNKVDRLINELASLSLMVKKMTEEQAQRGYESSRENYGGKRCLNCKLPKHEAASCEKIHNGSTFRFFLPQIITFASHSLVSRM